MKFSSTSSWVIASALVFNLGISTVLAQTGSKKASIDAQEHASTSTSSKLDILTSFRSAKFGTPLSEFEGLSLDQDRGAIKLYTKQKDNLKLGPAFLEAIVYYFFDDKFYAVSLHTNTHENTLILQRIAQNAFDPPVEDTPEGAVWLGKSASAFYSKNLKTEEGQLLLRDNKLGTDVEAYEEKSIQTAVDSL